MAPSLTAKSSSQGLKDIRGFLQGKKTQGSSPSKPTKQAVLNFGTTSKQAIEISDSDSEAKQDKPSNQAKPQKKAVNVASNKPPQNSKPASQAPPTKKRPTKPEELFDSDEDIPTASTSAPSNGTKRKSVAITSEEESEEEKQPPTKKAATARSSAPSKSTSSSKRAETGKPTTKAKRPPAKREKDDDFIVPDDDEEEEVNTKKQSGTSKAHKPSEPKAESQASQAAKKPNNWAAVRAARQAGPAAPGSKSVPNGKPNCLAGLCFVFTGELSSFSRDESLDMAKRFGGRTVTAPSRKTDYVVLGQDAGQKKLDIIKKLGLKTLDEDGFLNLIATREGVLDEKTIAAMEKEEEKVREAAKEIDKREKQATKQAAKTGVAQQVNPAAQLWTSKYAPQNTKEICGNKGQVEKLLAWLEHWEKSRDDGFRKAGKDGGNVFRAALLSGPPGVGKTTTAHLVAKTCGYVPIELNASDARSKKLVESGTNITNRSLDGWLGGGKATNTLGVEISGKPCLIMDEVDGMSSGDRGGVGALNALIKKTDVPIICIANDRNHPKMKPLLSTTFNLTYRKPQAKEIRSRLSTICFREQLKVPGQVLDELVTSAGSDIRQVINMLSTWKLSNSAMDFDQGKELSRASEKYQIMTPFSLTQKLLGPYVFSATSRETLNDKMDYYFQDFSFMPLFVQENYLKTIPNAVRALSGRDAELKRLEVMDKAASAISDGDLVDAMIHSSEQHWSLMPLHAIQSVVRPASHIFGQGMGYAGPGAMSFPGWLGQNSKHGKLRRQLADIQIRMRLKVSGDKAEIRQHYIPALFPSIVQPLQDGGVPAIPSVIETMDEYYLSREEWDSVVELGVGDRSESNVLKKIPTATKTAFTKKYNATEHPVAFHKATLFGAPKKMAAVAVPDLEEAFEVEAEDEDDKAKDEDVDDVTKDKLIKQSKAKKKTASAPKKKA